MAGLPWTGITPGNENRVLLITVDSASGDKDERTIGNDLLLHQPFNTFTGETAAAGVHRGCRWGHRHWKAGNTQTDQDARQRVTKTQNPNVCVYVLYTHLHVHSKIIKVESLSVLKGDFFSHFLCFARAFGFSKINV